MTSIFKKSILIPAIATAAIIAVSGLFVLNPNLFTKEASGSTTTSLAPVCQHWDKIVFTVKQSVLPDVDHPFAPLIAGNVYDIKVLDDPATIADINGKVVKFAISKGIALTSDNLVIINVGYALFCPPAQFSGTITSTVP